MHKLISSFGLALILSAPNAYGVAQAVSGPDALKMQKAKLMDDAKRAADSCRCLADQIEKHINLFPIDKNESGKKGKLKALIGKKPATAKYDRQDIYQFINDMKINAGRAQTEVGKILREWDDSKNTPQDIKNLNVKATEPLRGMSSYCSQPYEVLKAEIQKLHKNAKLEKGVCTKN